MDEEKKVTEEVEEVSVEQFLSDKIVSSEDADEIEKLSKALASVRKVCDENEAEYRRLELEAEKIEKETKESRRKTVWQFIGTIGAAIVGALGVVGAQYVKGEMDSRYQDEGYEHEKTESVIWNKNKHRR